MFVFFVVVVVVMHRTKYIFISLTSLYSEITAVIQSGFKKSTDLLKWWRWTFFTNNAMMTRFVILWFCTLVEWANLSNLNAFLFITNKRNMLVISYCCRWNFNEIELFCVVVALVLYFIVLFLDPKAKLIRTFWGN